MGQSRKPRWSLGVFGDSAAFPPMPHVFGLVVYMSGVGWLVLQDKGLHVLGSVMASGPAAGRPTQEILLSVAYLLPSQSFWATSFSPIGRLCRWAP